MVNLIIAHLHITVFAHYSRICTFKKNELLGRIELPTSSLPRKCSTTELQQLTQYHLKELLSLLITVCNHSTIKSGRRGSNPRPTAWKAVALPTELLPLNNMQLTICKLIMWHLPICTLSHLHIVHVGREGFEPPYS